jgi:hypothetical protein
VLTFRRWPAGITGIPRLREWDAVVFVDVPELARSELGELAFVAFVDGEAEALAGAGIPRRVIERMAAGLETKVERPYEARAVRKSDVVWSVGARTFHGHAFGLPAGFPASSLEVVVTPDGERAVTADGGEIPPSLEPLYEDAVAELERRGRERFQSFVVRADKVGDERWQLTIDPL